MSSTRDPRSMADEDLASLVAEANPDALETLYERHSGVAFSLAYRMIGTRSGAEDVVQDAFLNLWRAGARYDRSRGSVRNWLLGIVRNRAIDALRRSNVHEGRRFGGEGAAEQLESSFHTEKQAERGRDSREVHAAVDELPEAQSQVVKLAYFGGFSQTEIAEMLDTPVGTVKGRMRLALEKLHHRLHDQVEIS